MMSDKTNDEQFYWAGGQLPAEDFAQKYLDRATGLAGGDLGALQLLAHEHYYAAMPTGFAGDVPSSASVSRAGDQGENVQLVVNWLRSHVNAKHQLIVAPELAWGAQPVNTDSHSLADSSRGASVLETLWKSGNYNQQTSSAVLGAILYGEEFLFTRWNRTAGEQVAYVEGQVVYTGDLQCDNVMSWDVRRDRTANSFEASDWLSVRQAVNKWDLIAQHPDQREKILAAANSSTLSFTSIGGNPYNTTSGDKVVCHYFFHKRTPACPSGLQSVLINAECVLEYAPLEKCYWRLPIHRVAAGDIKGTPFGYSDLWEAMAIQDLSTDIQGSLATNIVAFGKQMLTVESGFDFPVSQIGNGPMVIYRPKGIDPPIPLQLTASPKEGFEHLSRLKADQMQILGLNDTALGTAPTGTPNAQAWALLSSAAITANSNMQRARTTLAQSVGRSMLDIFKLKADHKRKISIIGVHGAAVPHQEEWDKSTFGAMEDVTIEIANPISQTAAGRLELAKMYRESGFVQTPEQLQSVTETGKLEPLTQVLRNELIYIAFENEEILKGVVPAVKITDSHQLHVKEHRGPTFSADARQNPAVNAAADAHIKAHLDILLNPANTTLLQVFGQAIPQSATPPPQAGSMDMTKKPEDGSVAASMEPPLAAQNQSTDVKVPSAPKNPLTGDPVDNQ